VVLTRSNNRSYHSDPADNPVISPVINSPISPELFKVIVPSEFIGTVTEAGMNRENPYNMIKYEVKDLS